MSTKSSRLQTNVLLTLVALFTASLAATPPALAQGSTVATAETIKVTVRKTEENLQHAPVTVTAIDGQTMTKFNYDKIADLSARIPTLNVQVGGSGSGGQLSLRGIGSSNISAAFDSAVSVNFDGIQVSNMRIVQSSFFDVKQVEVLKGPQSLYFGKSASAGVISIKSNEPGNIWEYGGKIAYELEEKGTTLEAFAGGPINDKMGIRVAARWNNIDEWIINSAPAKVKERGQENINVRTTLQIDPTDNIYANLKMNYISHENDGAIANAVIDCGENKMADPISLFSDGAEVPTYGRFIQAGYNCDTSGDYYYRPDLASALAGQAASDEAGYQDINGGVPYGTSKIWFGRLEMGWDITDQISLTSVTGYLDLSAQDTDNYSYGGAHSDTTCGVTDVAGPLNVSCGAGIGLTDHQLRQFTQEVRLNTTFDAPINFQVGAFFEKRDIEFNTNQLAVNIAHVIADSITGNTTDYYKRHLYDNEALSIWGSINWDITDRLEFSGGVRWTDEKKVNTILVPYVHELLGPGPAFVGSGFDSGDIVFEDSNLSPEATLSYQLTNDINLYASYKTGFKSGGIDNSALPSNGLTCFGSGDEAVRTECAASLVFQSETGKGGEVGAKMQFLDRHLTTNVSAFYYVFEDLQVQNFDPHEIQFLTGNAGEVTTKGLDVDFNWLTPFDGLSLFGAVAYTDTKFSAPFDPNPNNADDLENLEGRAVARAPKWAGNIGANWRRAIDNDYELGVTANARFSTSYFTNEDSLDDIIQGSYITYDLAVSVGDPKGTWQFAVVGRNLTDKRFVTTSHGRPFLLPPTNGNGLPGGDDQVLNLNRGRQVFLEASVRF